MNSIKTDLENFSIDQSDIPSANLDPQTKSNFIEQTPLDFVSTISLDKIDEFKNKIDEFRKIASIQITSDGKLEGPDSAISALKKSIIKHKAFHVYLLLTNIANKNKLEQEKTTLQSEIDTLKDQLSKGSSNTQAKDSKITELGEKIIALEDQLNKYITYAKVSIPLHDQLSQLTV